MKTRRTTLVAFLLCAIMLLGVGFAAVIDDLAITGSMTTNNSATQVAFKEKIYFSSAVVKDPADAAAGDEANILTNANEGDDKDVVDLLVKSLKLKDDSTTFILTIHNDSDQYAAIITLGEPKVEGDASYFKVDYFDATDAVIPAGGIRCESEDDVVIKVVVTLLKSPDVTINGSFGVELTATSAEKALNG